MGYEGTGPLRAATLFHRSRDLPVVVEVVDEGHTEELLSFLNGAVGEGTVTVEDVWVWHN
jgi:PII-like signaling protein